MFAILVTCPQFVKICTYEVVVTCTQIGALSIRLCCSTVGCHHFVASSRSTDTFWPTSPLSADVPSPMNRQVMSSVIAKWDVRMKAHVMVNVVASDTQIVHKSCNHAISLLTTSSATASICSPYAPTYFCV